MVDSGSKKELGPEVAPEKALNFEDPDTKSVEMTPGVETSSKEVKDMEPLSPDTVLVVVGPSFKSNVEKEIKCKKVNTTEFLAIRFKHILTN